MKTRRWTGKIRTVEQWFDAYAIEPDNRAELKRRFDVLFACAKSNLEQEHQDPRASRAAHDKAALKALRDAVKNLLHPRSIGALTSLNTYFWHAAQTNGWNVKTKTALDSPTDDRLVNPCHSVLSVLQWAADTRLSVHSCFETGRPTGGTPLFGLVVDMAAAALFAIGKGKLVTLSQYGSFDKLVAILLDHVNPNAPDAERKNTFRRYTERALRDQGVFAQMTKRPLPKHR